MKRARPISRSNVSAAAEEVERSLREDRGAGGGVVRDSSSLFSLVGVDLRGMNE